ncbi:MAG: RNase P modulator RnpM [Limnochordia bacterium]|jgi:predicted RNA-binding protein YlxR (DUF448 family)
MPRPKRIPSRTCVGCRTVKAKKEMWRIVREPTGNISFDETGKRSGRGAYICPSPQCLAEALKSKALSRALQTEIPPEVIENLQAQLEGRR